MKVLCHTVHRELGVMMLRTLSDAYAERGDEVFWSYAPSYPERDALTIAALKQINARVVSLDHEVDVVLHVDPRNPPANKAPIFEVPHGINSKEGFFRPDVEYNVKYHLASSHWIAKRMQAWFPKTRFLPVGIPKLDPFRKTKFPGETRVLVCATHNDDIGLWPSFKEQIFKLQEAFPVIIRFHPFVAFRNPEWILEARRGGLTVDENQNIAHTLSSVTHVVSDISSAAMEALALGFPVIRMETNVAKEHLKNETVLEAQFNLFFTRCGEGESLIQLIEKAESAPKDVQEMLLINQGTATQKAMEVIDGIVGER